MMARFSSPAVSVHPAIAPATASMRHNAEENQEERGHRQDVSNELGGFEVGREVVSFQSPKKVAVGTIIADRPPHRSVRAALPHTAPTLDIWRQSGRSDKGVESVGEATSARTIAPATIRSVPTLDSGGGEPVASAVGSAPESASMPPDCRESRGIGSNLVTLAVTRRPLPPRCRASADAGSPSLPEAWPPSVSAPSSASAQSRLVVPRHIGA